jgi:hypothetical protein
MKKRPGNFRDITGLRREEINKIVEQVRPEWEKYKCKNSVKEDKIFCVILYYGTYITHRFLGYLFNMHNANICRLLKKIEPLLAKKSDYNIAARDAGISNTEVS